METTVDEDALPGKLPETPLRAEPPSSYKVNQVFGIISICITSIYGYSKENFFFVFLPFLAPLPWHMEIPRLGVESEL